MRGSTHALVGVALAVALTAHGQPIRLMAAAVAGGIGALLPDIDHPQSSISRRVWIAGGVLRLFISHRGALHSLIAAGIALALATLAPVGWSDLGQAVAVGYCSHIFCDALTVTGVPLLWPYKKRFRLMWIRTGGISERLFAVMVLALMLRTFIKG